MSLFYFAFIYACLEMYFFVIINKSYPWERIWSHILSFKDAPVYK